MDFNANFREKLPSHLPLLFYDNYSSKPRDEFHLDGAFSSKATNTNILNQHPNPIENFNINGSSFTSNALLFPIHEPNCLNPIENSSFEFLPNFEIYETKPFGNHHAKINSGFISHHIETLNQSGGSFLEHSNMINKISMINPNVQTFNHFSCCDLELRTHMHLHEDSCTNPLMDATMVISAPPILTTMRSCRKGRKNKTNVIKGNWTIEEDRRLIQLVEHHGIRKWSHIAEMLNGRIGKQCRERWHNHLRPNIKKESWSEEEDRILIKAHQEMGNKWAEIAKVLPGRTENSIKNHWNATKRRQVCRRKCRSKYPKQSSLLQDYVRSLTPQVINAGCRKKPFISSNNNNNNNNNNKSMAISSNNDQTNSSSQNDVFGEDYYGGFDEVPDFNFDAQILEESSIDSLLNCAASTDDNGGDVIGYGDGHYSYQGANII